MRLAKILWLQARNRWEIHCSTNKGGNIRIIWLTSYIYFRNLFFLSNRNWKYAQITRDMGGRSERCSTATTSTQTKEHGPLRVRQSDPDKSVNNNIFFGALAFRSHVNTTTDNAKLLRRLSRVDSLENTAWPIRVDRWKRSFSKTLTSRQ